MAFGEDTRGIIVYELDCDIVINGICLNLSNEELLLFAWLVS